MGKSDKNSDKEAGRDDQIITPPDHDRATNLSEPPEGKADPGDPGQHEPSDDDDE